MLRAAPDLASAGLERGRSHARQEYSAQITDRPERYRAPPSAREPAFCAARQVTLRDPPHGLGFRSRSTEGGVLAVVLSALAVYEEANWP